MTRRPGNRSWGGGPVFTTGLVLTLLGAGAAGAAVAQDLPAADLADPAAAPDTLSFVLADWSAEALGRQVAGTAGWVADPGGALRLDLTVRDDGAVDPPPGTGEAVLSRHGRGWTLVTGEGGDGVYGAWDREWQAPPAGLSELAHQVAALSALRGAGTSRRTLTLAADPTASAAPDRPRGDFRHALVTRGGGGGGPGERVTVRAAPGGGRVLVGSSRRPGRLEVVPRERRTALGVAEEVFLPWYPLGEVLTFPDAAEPGTSRPGRR